LERSICLAHPAVLLWCTAPDHIAPLTISRPILPWHSRKHPQLERGSPQQARQAVPEPLRTRLRDQLLENERVLLPTLGFDFAVEVPHQFIALAVGGCSSQTPFIACTVCGQVHLLLFGGCMQCSANGALSSHGNTVGQADVHARAWKVANNLMASTMPLLYPARLLACGLLNEAASHKKVKVCSLSPPFFSKVSPPHTGVISGSCGI